MSAIRADIGAARRTTWGTLAIVFLLMMAAWYWVVGHITRPVKPLAEAAEAIASGDYQQRLYVSNRDELGSLASTFNRISQELNARATQLSQSGARQATVLDGMIEGVIAVDARQRVVLANPAAGRLFDFRPAVVEGRPLLEVVRNHALHEAVSTALATGQPRRLETRREGAEKLRVDIHVQAMPGNPCPGVVLVMHDTTELRRLESLRRDFIANVSHELKTPLSAIKACAETLRNGAMRDAEAGQRFLGTIEEQSERLHRLIMDMLMLARIESDQQAFEIDAVDVDEVVASCLDDHRRAAESKQIALQSEPPESPIRVKADREGLREILDNLIDNAIKYTPQGGSVSVKWEQGAGSGEQGVGSQHRASSIEHPFARITVGDTGIGIKPQDLERVFERFYRVDKARSRELGGTGLGLAIVKHLTQSFGGKVAVESEPGQGSTFTVELPMA
jgi:two-component system phosphate regulon sensor histidine kinase PhoR